MLAEPEKFNCAWCGQPCGPSEEWTDEMVEAEAQIEFPGFIPTEENSDIVCDDCYKELGFDQNAH